MKRTTLCGLAFTTWIILVFSFNLTAITSSRVTTWQPSHRCYKPQQTFEPLDEMYLYERAQEWNKHLLKEYSTEITKEDLAVTILLSSLKGCAQDGDQAEAELISSGQLGTLMADIGFWLEKDNDWLQIKYDQLADKLVRRLQDTVIRVQEEYSQLLSELIYHRTGLNEDNWANGDLKLCNVVQAVDSLIRKWSASQSSADVFADVYRYFDHLYGQLLLWSLKEQDPVQRQNVLLALGVFLYLKKQWLTGLNTTSTDGVTDSTGTTSLGTI